MSILQYLLESSINNLTPEYVLELIDYSSYDDLYPKYTSDIKYYNDNFMFDSKESACEYANQILEIFDSLSNPITIYRTISVKSEDDIDKDNVGISWSFEKDSAINFGSRLGSNKVYLLEAKINKENVNWKSTIEAYIEFSDLFDGESENEIAIEDESKIFDLKIIPLNFK